MPRRFIAFTSLAAGAAIAVTVALATPAFAKGATQASITGPGLAHPVTVSVAAGSEALPGQGDALSSLADQTGLFTVLFGPSIGDVSMPGMPDMPSRLRPPPAAATLGPKYTVTYTVPGVTPAPGQASDQIRQYLYPRAAGGPVIYTLPGQHGFGQPLQATGWLRGTPQLTATLTRLGIPAGASLPAAPGSAASVPSAPASTAAVPAALAPAAAPKPNDTTAPAWLIAPIASAVAIVIAGTALWLRRRPRPAIGRPAAGRPATQETSGEPQSPGNRRAAGSITGVPDSPRRNPGAVSDRGRGVRSRGGRPPARGAPNGGGNPRS